MIWGSGGSPEVAPKTVPKKAPKRQRCQPNSGNYFGPFWVPSPIFVHFVCASFYAYFWHRFWEASGPNFADLGVISECLSGSFWTRFCRCCKAQKMQSFEAKYLFGDVLGLRFWIIFANLLHVLFMLLSRRPFCSILADLGLQRGFLLEHFSTEFVNFAWKKACWNWGMKMNHFWL